MARERGLLDLARDCNRWANRANEAGSEAKALVTRAIVRYLAYHTPVDTSQALSNWQVSFNGPYAPIISGGHYKGYAGSTQSASAEETIRRADAVLQNKIPGAVIFIANMLPYIRKLEEGSSLQARTGFVQQSLLAGRIALRGYKFRV